MCISDLSSSEIGGKEIILELLGTNGKAVPQPKNIKKYQKISKNIKKYQKISKDT